MSIRKKVRNENNLETELKHNITKTENTNKKTYKEEIKKYIKFDISLIDINLYKNHLILTLIYFVICALDILTGNIFSLLTPVFMFLLIVFLSSNPITIKNNRFLDVSIWNFINSFNMILKSVNLLKVNNIYKKIVHYFTTLFTISLLLSGVPAFNISFSLISTGLWISFLISFINKDIDVIKESCEKIQKNELLYVLISAIFFIAIFRGNVANATVFAQLVFLKYFHNSIKSFKINEINTTN